MGIEGHLKMEEEMKIKEQKKSTTGERQRKMNIRLKGQPVVKVVS